MFIFGRGISNWKKALNDGKKLSNGTFLELKLFWRLNEGNESYLFSYKLFESSKRFDSAGVPHAVYRSEKTIHELLTSKIDEM